ncbi:hypothetical protein N8I74_02765 [Chitiniphilus purpureus]|uniref:DUF1418 family protein n=1 Tax=Chitiniphilus purpureus TaxID=2981137 RepID=A0ABY6DNJ8_9NEIS|nr:hypothetical protein [Chitiniphilus sp. CD1]UXY15957.1 hypothetical protein N8I74_02765 [Chitiniphilus sp. CD1]
MKRLVHFACFTVLALEIAMVGIATAVMLWLHVPPQHAVLLVAGVGQLGALALWGIIELFFPPPDPFALPDRPTLPSRAVRYPLPERTWLQRRP